MYKRLLVPVDMGVIASLENALPAAKALASGPDAEIHVVSVVPTAGMTVVASYLSEDFMDKAIDAAKKQLANLLDGREVDVAPAALRGHICKGSIYQEILRTADHLKCDAIVMTAHSPELKDYLLGPNAARVVRHAKQSVMVVRV